jgi:hypothetical protein
LLQDVNVIRPLAYLAASDFDVRITFLLSDAFMNRDSSGIWTSEIQTLRNELDADLQIYDSPLSAYQFLRPKRGILIAGSESNQSGHAHVHELFRVAPESFLKITLQHGFECIGFLQNRDHNIIHGTRVSFAADVLCGWSKADFLTSMIASERSKLYVTGPQSLLQMRSARAMNAPSTGNGGLVCENLHSVRFSVEGERREVFIDDFLSFSKQLAEREQGVTLRPHPGGQYVLKNNVALPANVVLENAPIYRLDLSRFDFGISAPSTIVLDMVLAGIPVAIWRDPAHRIDTSNYQGLRTIGCREDWTDFESTATQTPEVIREEQARFLERLQMPLDPTEVRTRFARLLAGAGAPTTIYTEPAKPVRLLFIANAVIPSLEIFFFQPLKSLQDSGLVEISCLTEENLNASFQDPTGKETEEWIGTEVSRFVPDLIVLCRYSGPQSKTIFSMAKALGIKTIYHLDDDLLNIPPELGQKKYRAHNAPSRIESVTTGLQEADLIYCSTTKLMDRVIDIGFNRPIVAGSICSSSEILRLPRRRPSCKVGYMGFDHAHDLDGILPALTTFLRRNPHVQFELFGSIPKPSVLDEFGERISTVAPIRIYSDFRRHFSTMGWDVGICPLADTPFNHMKTDLKWVEYTAAGIAVIATAGIVYDDCCSDGCGMLAADEASWVSALETLCNDHDYRYRQVKNAQAKLSALYSIDRLRSQILEVFALAAGKPLFGAAQSETLLIQQSIEKSTDRSAPEEYVPRKC